MCVLELRWGSFANGEEGYEELDTPVAYRIGLKTWANWVDSTVNPNKTRVFFTTMSPTHTRSLSLSLSVILSERFSQIIYEINVLLANDSTRTQFEFLLFRSEDWNRKNGTKCFNETKPVMKKKHWGTGSDKKIMSVVKNVVGKMKVPVTVINITQISEYRIDAHSSVYTETGGKLLTDEEKADPIHHADCIHWCLPGVPDTWNQIFLAHL
jgi:hypothetical protein